MRLISKIIFWLLFAPVTWGVAVPMPTNYASAQQWMTNHVDYRITTNNGGIMRYWAPGRGTNDAKTDDLPEGVGATNLWFTVNRVYAILTNLYVNVMWPPWNAINDGVTDCTTNIQGAMSYIKDNGYGLYFPPGTYKITNSLHFTNTSFTGKSIWGNGAVIKTTSGMSNAIVLHSSASPYEPLRNVGVNGITFDGTVSGAFLLVDNSAAWGCSFEGIRATYLASSSSLLELRNASASYQGGQHVIRNLMAYDGVTNIIHATVLAGCLHLFDSLIIENTSSESSLGGSVIYLGENAYLVDSKVTRLFKGGSGSIIKGDGNTYCIDTTIESLYAEATGATFIGVNVGLVRSTLNNVHIYLDPIITTTSRCFYNQANNSKISNLTINDTAGVAIAGTYYQEVDWLNSTNNWLDRIGDNHATSIVLNNSHSTIAGINHNPFIFGQDVTVATNSIAIGKTPDNTSVLDLQRADAPIIKLGDGTNQFWIHARANAEAGAFGIYDDSKALYLLLFDSLNNVIIPYISNGVLKANNGYITGGATNTDVGAAALVHTHLPTDIIPGTFNGEYAFSDTLTVTNPTPIIILDDGTDRWWLHGKAGGVAHQFGIYDETAGTYIFYLDSGGNFHFPRLTTDGVVMTSGSSGQLVVGTEFWTYTTLTTTQTGQWNTAWSHSQITGNPHNTSWTNLNDIPATFPPDSHNHTYVTGSGTATVVPMWSGSTTNLADSHLVDNTTYIDSSVDFQISRIGGSPQLWFTPIVAGIGANGNNDILGSFEFYSDYGLGWAGISTIKTVQTGGWSGFNAPTKFVFSPNSGSGKVDILVLTSDTVSTSYNLQVGGLATFTQGFISGTGAITGKLTVDNTVITNNAAVGSLTVANEIDITSDGSTHKIQAKTITDKIQYDAVYHYFTYDNTNGCIQIDPYYDGAKNKIHSLTAIAGSAYPLQIDASITDFTGPIVLYGGGPAHNNSAGTTGEFRYDASYIYVCTSGGAEGAATWKRVTLQADSW